MVRRRRCARNCRPSATPRAALPGPGHQHVPAGRRAGVASTVDHDHVSGRDVLDRLPLQRVPGPVRVQRVDVLPGRDEPHRERLTDKPVHQPAQRTHADQRRLPEPPPIQLRRQRGRADPAELSRTPAGSAGGGCDSMVTEIPLDGGPSASGSGEAPATTARSLSIGARRANQAREPPPAGRRARTRRWTGPPGAW